MTKPITQAGTLEKAENAINRAVRHCRIGKVTRKVAPYVPVKFPQPDPSRSEFWRPLQPSNPWDAPLVTWEPPPVIWGVQIVEPRDTYTLSGASHAR